MSGVKSSGALSDMPEGDKLAHTIPISLHLATKDIVVPVSDGHGYL